MALMSFTASLAILTAFFPEPVPKSVEYPCGEAGLFHAMSRESSTAVVGSTPVSTMPFR